MFADGAERRRKRLINNSLRRRSRKFSRSRVFSGDVGGQGGSHPSDRRMLHWTSSRSFSVPFKPQILLSLRVSLAPLIYEIDADLESQSSTCGP